MQNECNTKSNLNVPDNRNELIKTLFGSCSSVHFRWIFRKINWMLEWKGTWCDLLRSILRFNHTLYIQALPWGAIIGKKKFATWIWVQLIYWWNWVWRQNPLYSICGEATISPTYCLWVFMYCWCHCWCLSWVSIVFDYNILLS